MKKIQDPKFRRMRGCVSVLGSPNTALLLREQEHFKTLPNTYNSEIIVLLRSTASKNCFSEDVVD